MGERAPRCPQRRVADTILVIRRTPHPLTAKQRKALLTLAKKLHVKGV